MKSEIALVSKETFPTTALQLKVWVYIYNYRVLFGSLKLFVSVARIRSGGLENDELLGAETEIEVFDQLSRVTDLLTLTDRLDIHVGHDTDDHREDQFTFTKVPIVLSAKR